MRRRIQQVRQCLCGFTVAVTIVLVINPYLVINLDKLQVMRQKQFLIPYRVHHSTTHSTTTLKTESMVCSNCQPHGPRRLVTDVDCQRIIEGDEKYMDWAKKSIENKKFRFESDADIGDIAEKCDVFLSKYDYGNFYVTKEEMDFPIAFSILTYKDAMQTEKLLRSIYRPHNVYCIHVDKNAQPSLHRAIRNIANCLHNVFIASQLEDVIYAGFSRLQADLNCISDLLNFHSVPWKYFINIPHQQYPLKTNSEIVKILKIYNGANDVEGITDPARMFRIRYLKSFKLQDNKIVNTGKSKHPPPYNITIVKGSAYGIFSRAFVNFSLHDEIAKDLLDWCRDVKSPDEYFWATLNFNKRLHAPGGYSDNPDKKPWLAVYAAWGGVNPCHGRFVRGVCVFGLGDLTELVSKKELFANKFYYDYQPHTLQCLEEWHLNKTFSNLPFQTHYYRELPFIKKVR